MWPVMKPLTLPMPDAVIFDFDGVIVDSEPLHYKAFQGVLEPLGIGFPWEEYVDSYMGFDDRDAFLEAFRSRGKDLDDRRLAQLVASKSSIFLDIVGNGVRAYPGTVSLIRSLDASGLPLAISSGALRSDILPILDILGITRCFPHVISADDVRKSKPDPECYLLAFRRLKEAHPLRISTPDRCLVIEDTPAGIRSAKLAGLSVLAVTNSYGGKQLTEADHLTDSLEKVRIS
jgi:beta-phosphoglucomutase